MLRFVRPLPAGLARPLRPDTRRDTAQALESAGDARHLLGEATGRIVEAARRCIEEDDPALVYCTTNDDVFHHYASGDPKGERQIADVGARVAKIFADDPMRQIYLTGDHSMSQKTTIANMQHVCDETASKCSAWGLSRTATS